MLRIIFLRGPFKEGILRKSSSKSRIEDFHRRIDNGEEDVLTEDTDPLLAGCLLKVYMVIFYASGRGPGSVVIEEIEKLISIEFANR